MQAYRLLDNVRIKNYILTRTKKVIEERELETIATQEDALKALSDMITSGYATQATSKKVKRVETDDKGNSVTIEETVASIKPSDMTKAIELMARLQGWNESGGKDDNVTIVNDLGEPNGDD